MDTWPDLTRWPPFGLFLLGVWLVVVGTAGVMAVLHLFGF